MYRPFLKAFLSWLASPHPQGSRLARIFRHCGCNRLWTICRTIAIVFTFGCIKLFNFLALNYLRFLFRSSRCESSKEGGE